MADDTTTHYIDTPLGSDDYDSRISGQHNDTFLSLSLSHIPYPIDRLNYLIRLAAMLFGRKLFDLKQRYDDELVVQARTMCTCMRWLQLNLIDASTISTQFITNLFSDVFQYLALRQSFRSMHSAHTPSSVYTWFQLQTLYWLIACLWFPAQHPWNKTVLGSQWKKWEFHYRKSANIDTDCMHIVDEDCGAFGQVGLGFVSIFRIIRNLVDLYYFIRFGPNHPQAISIIHKKKN